MKYSELLKAIADEQNIEVKPFGYSNYKEATISELFSEMYYNVEIDWRIKPKTLDIDIREWPVPIQVFSNDAETGFVGNCINISLGDKYLGVSMNSREEAVKLFSILCSCFQKTQ